MPLMKITIKILVSPHGLQGTLTHCIKILDNAKEQNIESNYEYIPLTANRH